MAAYEQEANALGPADIFKELERLQAIQRLKNLNGKDVWAMDEDTFKSVGYAMALEKRRKRDEPLASFYYGLHNSRVCAGLQTADKDQAQSQWVRDCWSNTMESFKVASKAQIAAASANVARMYESGFGVSPSKLVAAEWYLQAATQYNKDGERDQALTALESALTLEPDLPAAQRFKREMLK